MELAAQRISLVKVGGIAADVILVRLGRWAAAKQPTNPDQPESWPPQIRAQADSFAERLRAHALRPPVIHFVEWADLWSMGDLFLRVLTPQDAPAPIVVHANRFEICAYGLPDSGRLAEHLTRSAQYAEHEAEANWFIARLREAVEAWSELVDRAVLVVLRQVTGASVLDEQVSGSLEIVPDWLAEPSWLSEPHDEMSK